MTSSSASGPETGGSQGRDGQRDERGRETNKRRQDRPDGGPPDEPRKSARSGDTPEQRDAPDAGDRPPAEGAVEDYDKDVQGSPEPPG